MNFSDYQKQAQQTDQYPEKSNLHLPFMGLAEEAGSISRLLKRLERNKGNYRNFKGDLQEKLGDLLWYVANISSKLDIQLEAVAKGNLGKIKSLWKEDAPYALLDEGLEAEEQLPRVIEVTIRDFVDKGVTKKEMIHNGERLGDPLTDNAHSDDGYRFHDVFHLANAAILGWSPVIRALIKRKRKSLPQVDEVEDGARAKDIEEGLTSFIF